MIAEQMQVELMNEIKTTRFVFVLSGGSTDFGVLIRWAYHKQNLWTSSICTKQMQIVFYQQSNLLARRFSSDCKPENENKLECYLEQDLESLHKSLLL